MTTLSTVLAQHKTPLHVGDDEDEGRYVRLIVDLSKGETIAGHRRPTPELVGAIERVRALATVEGPLAHPANADIELLLMDYDRLNHDREVTEEWSHIWRDLDPDEARAVAAALWHFAGEIERPR